jgi:hypothetical protein
MARAPTAGSRLACASPQPKTDQNPSQFCPARSARFAGKNAVFTPPTGQNPRVLTHQGPIRQARSILQVRSHQQLTTISARITQDQNPASSYQHPTTAIQHRASSNQHRVWSSDHQSSITIHQSASTPCSELPAPCSTSTSSNSPSESDHPPAGSTVAHCRGRCPSPASRLCPRTRCPSPRRTGRGS